MATEQERTNSGQYDRGHRENAGDQVNGRHPNDNNPHLAGSADAGDAETGHAGTPADHLTQTPDDGTHQPPSFQSKYSKSIMRPDSVESESNKLEGKKESSDYIDTDDEKELGTQSGTFFNDEQGTPRGT